MNQITERVTRVIAARATSVAERKLTEYVLGSDSQKLQEARQEERAAKAKALARASADNNTADTTTTTEPTSPGGVGALAAEEDCPVCASILAAVREMDEPRRTKGVAEYGEFRRAIENSEEAAEAVLDDSEVLVDALGDMDGVTP